MTSINKENPPERTWDDATALDQIAATLGLFHTNPGANPVEEVLSDIDAAVKNTGRPTNVGEGA